MRKGVEKEDFSREKDDAALSIFVLVIMGLTAGIRFRNVFQYTKFLFICYLLVIYRGNMSS